jgi:hypothetical protein
MVSYGIKMVEFFLSLTCNLVRAFFCNGKLQIFPLKNDNRDKHFKSWECYFFEQPAILTESLKPINFVSNIRTKSRDMIHWKSHFGDSFSIPSHSVHSTTSNTYYDLNKWGRWSREGILSLIRRQKRPQARPPSSGRFNFWHRGKEKWDDALQFNAII